MSTDIKILLILVIFLILLDLMVMAILFFRRCCTERNRLSHGNEKKKKINQKATLQRKFNYRRLERKSIKRLNSRKKLNRIEAAVHLGMLATDRARDELEKAIIKEDNYTVKLYMANSLVDIGSEASIPVLVDSLINGHRFYRERVNMLISELGEMFNNYIPKIAESRIIEIKELIVDFATVNFSKETKDYLIHLVDNKKLELERLKETFGGGGPGQCCNCIYNSPPNQQDYQGCKYYNTVRTAHRCKRHQRIPISLDIQLNYKKLVYKACNILAEYDPAVLNNDKYLKSDDNEIKNIAVFALSNIYGIENFRVLMRMLKDTDTKRSVVYAIDRILENHPLYINTVINTFYEEEDVSVKKELAKILSGRIEYFIVNLYNKKGRKSEKIIQEILLLGSNRDFISFLNKNEDIDIENYLVKIIKEVMKKAPFLEKDFSEFLLEHIVRKCGIYYVDDKVSMQEKKEDRRMRVFMHFLMVFCIVFVPFIYCIRHYNILLRIPIMEQVKLFVIEFNYYLAYYSLSINMIYLTLMILSYLNARQQAKMWRIKSMSLLFKKRMLPAVSLIAPAYNEEKTIIESVNSLLNLKYPDYELIIVNDGSKDATLDNLIEYFKLVRVDYMFDYKLNTKIIYGIYLNRSMPKLIVVDKANGGKADALNAGINISNKEYFCGIDADSLLEEEALLKLTSLTLDEAVETPALGGNVLPINGCTVELGVIKNKKIPKNYLARFQTIEYLRAFMAGRLGWAKLNSLLIISGAFGLFRKERVIDVGGYLSDSGQYQKNTVGEDMELVVRVSRFMREQKYKYRICYAFHANCWTEVPEDIMSLKKQRLRWHKGLIDILFFHRKMILNYKYGKTGLLALPYFVVFELIGPIFESMGLFMVFCALAMGILDQSIVLILFITIILMGILTSISSIFISEMNEENFLFKDFIILIFYAVIENFGIRQLFSFWRVGAFVRMFKNQGGWEKAERRGFKSHNVVNKR